MRAGSLLLCILATVVLAAADADDGRWSDQREIFGTQATLQLVAEAETSAVDAAEWLWQEAERWQAIASTWSADSEIGRLLRQGGDGSPQRASFDLLKLLAEVDGWRERSAGLLQPRVALATAAWQEAAAAGRPPSEAGLAALQPRMHEAPWRLDLVDLSVAFTPPVQVTLDAVAKGAIIHRLLAGLQRRGDLLGAGLSIGGDVGTWGAHDQIGDTSWPVAVADPAAPGGEPLARLVLRGGQAVATSGVGARPIVIGEESFSPIIDPRTVQPTSGLRSATVIADDAATADALATLVLILGPEAGLAAIEERPTVEALLITDAGAERASTGWRDYLDPAHLPAPTESRLAAGPPWPQDWLLQVDVELNRRTPKAYFTAWVEDDGGGLVRLLAFWGGDDYAHTMLRWRRHARHHREAVELLTEATRRPGHHRLSWDGRDQQGRAVPQGDYRICIEVNREHGERHYLHRLLPCRAAVQTHEFDKNSNVDSLRLHYGPPTP